MLMVVFWKGWLCLGAMVLCELFPLYVMVLCQLLHIWKQVLLARAFFVALCTREVIAQNGKRYKKGFSVVKYRPSECNLVQF